jgi:YesN/AraC family two-component response regulator
MAKQAREAGAKDYLVKPITVETLLPALERVYIEKCSHQ